MRRLANFGAVVSVAVLAACGGGSGGGGGGGASFPGFAPDHVTITNPGGAQDFLYGSTVAWLDWNQDGRLDFVTGSPGQSGGGLSGVGAAFLYTQDVAGTFTLAKTLGPTNWLGGANVASAHFGAAVAVGDFDHDGRLDVAIGAPGDAVGATLDAGKLYLMFNDVAHTGTLVGPISEPGGAQAGAEFGSSLATGRLNGDLFDDLVVSATNATVAAQDGAGRIVGVLGGAVAASFGGSTTATITSPTPVADGFFGVQVAVGDVNGDGAADLAVGEPGAVVGAGGAVRILAGNGAAIPTFVAFQTLSTGEAGSLVELGTSVVLADVDGDGDLDVASGAPYGDVGATVEAGYLLVYRNTNPAAGVFAASEPIPDRTQESGAQFGASLVAADVNGDLVADLLASAPVAGASGAFGAGTVTVFVGDGAGTFAQPSAASVLHAESPADDMAFGVSVAAGDTNGDGTADLFAVGAAGPIDPLLLQPGLVEVVVPNP